jgi:hypothetical protein
MKSIVHHAAPNIVPGVNFTAARFAELYAWTTSQTADSVQAVMGNNHYGLMIPYDGKAALTLEKSGNQLILSRCCGITPQGNLVALFEEMHEPMVCDLTRFELHSNETYQVVLEVASQQKRRPFGPETADLPLRPAYSMLAYDIQIQPFGQAMTAQPDAFPIGNLFFENGDWKLTDYIPPCVHLGASPTLQNRYLKYQEAIKILLEAQALIVRQTESFQEKSMIELREMTLQLGSLLASRQPRYRQMGVWGNPYEMFELWAAFAQQFSFLLQCLSNRPGFNNLLNENTRDVNGVFYTPQSLDKVLQELTGLQYDHNRIAQAVQATDRFLQMIVPIFKALSIGFLRSSPNGVIVEETPSLSFTW